mgnify:CR=1 FL=1
MTEDQVRELVRAQASKPFARQAGVSVAYVDMVKSGERSPGPAIIAALGLRKVIAYEEIACNSRVAGA